MTATERTLVLAKPDAMQRGLATEILVRLERRGLRIAALKLIRIDEALAAQHYAEHVGKPFYAGAGRVHHERPGGRRGFRRPERDPGGP